MGQCSHKRGSPETSTGGKVFFWSLVTGSPMSGCFFALSPVTVPSLSSSSSFWSLWSPSCPPVSCLLAWLPMPHSSLCPFFSLCLPPNGKRHGSDSPHMQSLNLEGTLGEGSRTHSFCPITRVEAGQSDEHSLAQTGLSLKLVFLCQCSTPECEMPVSKGCSSLSHQNQSSKHQKGAFLSKLDHQHL